MKGFSSPAKINNLSSNSRTCSISVRENTACIVITTMRPGQAPMYPGTRTVPYFRHNPYFLLLTDKRVQYVYDYTRFWQCASEEFIASLMA